jgi:hypothetical protein
MLCYAMLCYAMLCYAMLCYAMLCYAMLCYAMLCYATLRYAMLCYAMLCYAMLCYAMLCYAMHEHEMLLMTTWTILPTWRLQNDLSHRRCRRHIAGANDSDLHTTCNSNDRATSMRTSTSTRWRGQCCRHTKRWPQNSLYHRRRHGACAKILEIFHFVKLFSLWVLFCAVYFLRA